MAKVFFGDVCAAVPDPRGGKSQYHRIGAAFKDGERISIKIDTLPITASTWQGWCNVFERAQGTRAPEPPAITDEDITF